MACTVLIDRRDGWVGSEVRGLVEQRLAQRMGERVAELDRLELRFRRHSRGRWPCHLIARMRGGRELSIDALASNPFDAADAALASLVGHLGLPALAESRRANGWVTAATCSCALLVAALGLVLFHFLLAR
jgi:hypothetical protein